jgi:hypothetical protein
MNNRRWKAISNVHLGSCRQVMIKESYPTLQGEVTDAQQIRLKSK